ncbi:MAG TPA: hypothetical protein VL282_07015 [Tepidisphaeraceae bacterium]|nr:hypothetical protein [Tepidisphaeraceae bacterium]
MEDGHRYAIPLADFRAIKSVPIEREGRPWIGIEISHANEVSVLPVRGIPQDEIDWLVDRVRECIHSQTSSTVNKTEVLHARTPHPGTSIVHDNGHTIVRISSPNAERELESSERGLTMRLSGWCETRTYTWAAEDIFDLRRSWDPLKTALLLFLKSGEEIRLADHMESEKIESALNALRPPLHIQPIAERSRKNLEQPIDPVATEPPDPAFQKNRELSYARTFVDAPLTTQVDGTFTVYFPATGFWHAWIREFIRILPPFIILQSWLGLMSAASARVPRFWLIVLLLQFVVCLVTFVVVAVKAYGRCVRLIVSDASLMREMEARYTHSYSHWPCEKIREVQADGSNLKLLIEHPPNDSSRSPIVLASYADRKELARIAQLLRIALGLAPLRSITANPATAQKQVAVEG